MFANAWSGPQWLLFGGFVCMGTGLLGLLWLAAQRIAGSAQRRRADLPAFESFAAEWQRVRYQPARILPAGPYVEPRTGELLDDITAHLAPGPGSLTSLRDTGEGQIVRVTHADIVAPEVEAAFAFVFDRPAYSPRCDEAGIIDDGGVLTRFHIAIEAAMRKARLWEIQSHADHRGAAGLWAQLDDWRIFSPTGELPIYERPEVLASLTMPLPVPVPV